MFRVHTKRFPVFMSFYVESWSVFFSLLSCCLAVVFVTLRFVSIFILKIKVILGHKWNTYNVDTLIIIATAKSTTEMVVTFDSCDCDNTCNAYGQTTQCVETTAKKKPIFLFLQQNKKQQQHNNQIRSTEYVFSWCTNSQMLTRFNRRRMEKKAVIIIIAGFEITAILNYHATFTTYTHP